MILETRINEYNIKQKPKPKKDYAGIGAVIFTFTVLSIVIALSIYTAWQIAYGQEVNNNTNSTNKLPPPEFNCFDTKTSHDIFSEYYGASRCVLS